MARNFTGGASIEFHNPNIGVDGPFTVSCWIYETLTYVDGRAIVNYGRGGTSTTRGWFLSVNGSQKAELRTYPGTAGQAVAGTTTIAIDTWYHVAAVKEASGVATTRIYVNGASEGTNTVDTVSAPNSTDDIFIGVTIPADNTGRESWRGRICEVMYWQAALTADEIRGVMLGQGREIQRSALKSYPPIWGRHSTEPDLARPGVVADATGGTFADHAPVKLFSIPRSFLEVSAAAQDATVNAPVLTATAAVQAPSAVVAIAPAVLTATGAAQAPVPAVVHSPAAQAATASLPAHQLVIDSTVTPAVLTATAAVQTPAPQVQHAPAAIAGTAALQSPSVAIDATFAAPALTASASVQTPVVGATVSPQAQSAASSVQSPGFAVAAQPSALTATAAVQAPVPAVTVGTTQQSVTAAVQTVTVSAGGNATANVAVLTAAATLNAPTVSITADATVNPAVLTATTALPAPTPAVSTAPAALAVVAAVQAPTVETGTSVTVSPSVLVASASLPAPTVSTSANVTISAAVLSAVASIPTPEVSTPVFANDIIVTARGRRFSVPAAGRKFTIEAD